MRHPPVGARHTSTRHLATPLAVALCVLLAGCTVSGGSSSEAGAGDYPMPGAVDAGVSAPDMAVSEGARDGAAQTVDSDEGVDRSVISQGSMSITVEDPLDAADDAVAIVEASGGRIDSRVENPAVPIGPASDSDASSPATARLVVRIPSAALTTTLDALERLGEARQVQITATDVTAEAQDLDARIIALTASTDRLLALLGASASTTDLIAIEGALSTRQSELESLQAQKRSLGEQVALATITVDFGSIADAPIDPPETFLSGLASGWDALVGFCSALLIAVGVALPWVAAATLVAAIVLAVARARRRRPGLDEPVSTK